MIRRIFKSASLITLLTLLVLSRGVLAQNLIVDEYFANRAYEFAPDGTNLGLFASSNKTSRFDGMAFDTNDNLYVADQGSLVRLFSPTGADLGNFAIGLNNPIGVVFDSNGNLYVSNFYGNTVSRFSPTGTDMIVFAHVVLPDHMAFDRAGNLYVGSWGTSPATVRKFSPTGQDLGVFASVISNAVGGLAFDTAGNLYASDRGQNAILRFSPTGADLGVFASTGLSTPVGLAFDANGNLCVANYDGSTVRRFSAAGTDMGNFITGLASPSCLAFRRASVLVTVANVSGAPGRTVLLRALLRRKPDAVVVVGRMLTFRVAGTVVGSAVTGSNGLASLNYTIPANATLGDQTITVELPQDLLFNADSGTGTLTVQNPIDTLVTVANPNGAVGQTVLLRGLLRRKPDGARVTGKRLTFQVDNVTVGTAVTDADGLASLNYAVSANLGTGSHTITVTLPQDSLYNASSGIGTLTVYYNTLLQAAGANGIAGKSVLLRALLRRFPDAAVVTGETITFQIDGTSVGTATTGSNGLASLNYTVSASLGPGSHTIAVSFAGDGTYQASHGTATLGVQYNTLTTAGSASGKAGQTVLLRGLLRRYPDGAGVAGETLTFAVDGKTVGTGTTDSSGHASVNYALPAGTTAGSHTITVTFAGDGGYLASSGTATLTVNL